MAKLNAEQLDNFNNFKKANFKKIIQLFNPSNFWKKKSNLIEKSIVKNGINSFRSLNQGSGTSFTDTIDYSIFTEETFINSWEYKTAASVYFFLPRFLKKKLINFFKQNNKSVLRYIDKSIYYQQKYAENNKTVLDIVENYDCDNTLNFECKNKIKINNKEISLQYLEELNLINSKKDIFKQSKVLIEIGGGFGSFTHNILNNFKNVKKVIYLDMFPQIFIGYEYLKKIFQKNVFYLNDEIKKFEFKNDDSLEICCILPNQLEKLNSKVDLLVNNNSFIEMSPEQVKFYISNLDKISRGQNYKIFVSSYNFEQYSDQRISFNVLEDILKKKLKVEKIKTLFPKNSKHEETIVIS